MSQPNILFIQSDQHRYDCVGANGHPFIQTPNMDRIAAEGMRFTHAFCPIPMCVPTRNSFLTGQWPTSHKVIVNYDGEGFRPQPSAPRSFVNSLVEAGYDTCCVGRWHVDPILKPQDFGFHHYFADWEYGNWRRDSGLPPQPKGNRWFGEVDSEISPEQSRLHWMADHVIELLRQRCAKARKPFYLSWDTAEPHLPNRVPEPYASMYKPEDIPPWPGYADSLEGKPYIHAQQRRTWHVDQYEWKDWAPMVSRYFADITLLDAQIGRILDALEELGLSEDTLVIYTSDHGDMCGSHGMIDKHYIMYDDVVRVPMMARWPGHIEPGVRSDAFVINSLDWPRTFCDVGGGKILDQFEGRSLRPLFEGQASVGREDTFAMYQGNQFGLFSQRMIRDRRWKYVWNATAEDELYDLETDPGELTNLAMKPEHQNELKRLRGRLVEWMEEIDDTLLNQWTKPQLLEGLTR